MMDNKPNIVIILLDAARADNFPFYGYHRQTTPFLDSVKDDLAIYQHPISSSYWTMPSIASLFTGMYTSAHGLVADGDRIDGSLATLPGVLRRSGYQCASFNANVYVSEYSGLTDDFDATFSATKIDRLKKIVSTFSGNFLKRLQPPGITRKTGEDTRVAQFMEDSLKDKLFNMAARSMDIVIDRGGQEFVSSFSTWLRNRGSEPFFSYFHIFETHSPFRAPFANSLKFLSLKDNWKKLFINHDHIKHLLGRGGMTPGDFAILLAAYDNSIYYADKLIKKIFNLLKSHNLYDDTMI